MRQARAGDCGPTCRRSGPTTVEGAHAAGLAGIGVEADSAFVLDYGEMVKRADELGLFVIGLTAGEPDMTVSPPLRIAIVAGEESGDLLGADLVRALQRATGRDVELVGIGGRHLQALGLKPLVRRQRDRPDGRYRNPARPAAADPPHRPDGAGDRRREARLPDHHR